MTRYCMLDTRFTLFVIVCPFVTIPPALPLDLEALWNDDIYPIHVVLRLICGWYFKSGKDILYNHRLKKIYVLEYNQHDIFLSKLEGFKALQLIFRVHILYTCNTFLICLTLNKRLLYDNWLKKLAKKNYPNILDC